MIKKYVPIDSVDDIDLSRISIANINDRYIDKKGNRFATRFNLRTKKIQIVRIALGEDEAKKARGKIVQGLIRKKIPNQNTSAYDQGNLPEPESISFDDDSETTERIAEVGGTTEKPKKTDKFKQDKRPVPEWIVKLNIQPADSVKPGDIMALMEEEYKLLSERLFGIINNVKNSGVMNETAEIDDAIDFTNIYDHNIHPKMESAKKIRDELQKYAEKAEHYFTMVEKSYRKFLRELPENEIMEFLKAYFIAGTCMEVLEETLGFVTKVREKTSHANLDAMEGDKRQFLTYAYATCEFLENYVKEQGAKLLRWMINEKVFEG